jgi:hypothetical protein
LPELVVDQVLLLKLKMGQKGFASIFSLNGGVIDWQAAGKPVVNN